MTTWDAVIDAEPALEIVLADDQLEAALEAIADFTDLKSPYTIGHSRGVADLAGAATQLYGLSHADAKLVRRAGLLHDLGRLGVSNAIWDKPGRADAGRDGAGAPASVPDRADAGVLRGAGAAGGDRRPAPRAPRRLGLSRADSRATRSRRRDGSWRRPTPITR